METGGRPLRAQERVLLTAMLRGNPALAKFLDELETCRVRDTLGVRLA